MSFKGKLGNYEVVPTQDGSTTLYSQYFGEACHSTSGATIETISHYVQGTKLLDQDNPQVLEIGFGTGLGYRTNSTTTRNLN